jgi:selenocysteine lyase/cysteine desulfurase
VLACRSQFSNGYRRLKLGAAPRERDPPSSTAFSIGNSVLDVTDTPIDILRRGQKWPMSPWGSGFIYVRKARRAAEPMITGWMALKERRFLTAHRVQSHVPPDARRFEMITLPYQDFVGMTTSLQLLLEIGVREVAEVTR